MTGRLTVFEVTGTDQFPIKLLAKQNCFPATEGDAALIDSCWNKTNRTIKLKGLKPPSLSEWIELGWSPTIIRGSRPMDQEYEAYHTWPC